MGLMNVLAPTIRVLLLTAILALVLVVSARAEVKLYVWLDPEAARDSNLAIRLKSKDSHGPEIARANAGAGAQTRPDARRRSSMRSRGRRRNDSRAR